MEILIRGLRYIVTQDDRRRILKNSSILIKEGMIESVGKADGHADYIIDGRRFVAVPGLINTHAHVPMTLFRGVADDMELFPWLQKKIWPMEANLKPYHIKAGTELGILEAVKTGTTTLFDMYFFEDAIAEVFTKFGVRGVLAEAILDFGTPECKDADTCINIADRFVERWRGHQLIKPGYGPHAPYTVSPERLRCISERASDNNSLIQIHLAETEREVNEVKERTGKRPIDLAMDAGILGPKTIAAHVVWPSEKEIELLAQSGALVSHNPISNLKLASGFSPVPDMINRGVKVSLGTDGPASNNLMDLMETIKVTALIHKAVKKDPTVMPAQLVFDMATRIPGDLLDWKIGRIEPGYEADIVLLDTKLPWWTPLHSVISHLVYSARSTDVKYVLIKGNLIVENGTFTKKDEDEIMMEAEKASLDLLDKSGVSSMLKSMN